MVLASGCHQLDTGIKYLSCVSLPTVSFNYHYICFFLFIIG
jgi:hypothetical protein